jgi:hypothetical protein
MKRTSVLQAQTVRAINIQPSGWFGYLPEAIKAFAEQYKFVKFPTTPLEMLPVETNQPISFRQGKVDLDSRSIIISELQVFTGGIIAFTQTNTTDCDLVADHVLEWAKSYFKLSFEPVRTPGHFSQLEVQFDAPFNELLEPFRKIGEAITNGLDDFWNPPPTYELVGLHFGYDPTSTPRSAPVNFRIERRTDFPFDNNVYFSEAAMTTNNHIAVLGEFERICLERFMKG